MNVESLWLAREHVNWETGEPDKGADYEGPGNHSHCSAFTAAAAKRLGVYLLRPPEHGQVLLANAQADWISSAAAQKSGWESVSDMREAQRLANQGNLVLALFHSPDKHVPGHVAIVRPSEKSLKALREDGPQIIQAGNQNYASTNVRIGFRNHPGAWPERVLYYVHTLPRRPMRVE
jgi:LmbE family N-acetylglucosaminyl deacetylase